MKIKKFISIIISIIILFVVIMKSVSMATNEEEASQTIEDGVYVISSGLSSSLVLDVSDLGMTDNTNITLWKKNSQYNQKFQVTYLNDGYYKIVAVHSGKSLSGTNDNAENLDNVMQKTYEGTDTQKWIIKDAGDGYYYIISKASSLYLDVYEAQASNGANLELYEGNSGANQKFKFEKVTLTTGTKTVDEGIYTISTALDFNQVLDVFGASTANNTNIEMYIRNTGKNQQFQLEYTEDGYYTIKSVNSGKYLTVQDSSTTGGPNVVQYEELGTDVQKWVIKSSGDGNYYIISKINNLYLDLEGGTSSSGTNVEVYSANGKTWQKFYFYEVDNSTHSQTIASGNYVITSQLNEQKVLDVESDIITDNTNIDIWTSNGQNNQKFIVTYQEDGYYTIKSFSSNKVLTVQNSSAVSGANVVQSYYTGADSQKWFIEEAGNGYYYIISKYSGMVLDLEGATSSNGTNVEVYLKNGRK